MGGADHDEIRFELLRKLMQPARGRTAWNGLGLGVDGFRCRLDLAGVLRLCVAEMLVEATPDRVELEDAGHDELGAARVSNLLAERERVLRLVAVVIANEDLTVHIGLLWPWSASRRHGEIEVAQNALRHLVRPAPDEQPRGSAQRERVYGRPQGLVRGDRPHLLGDRLGCPRETAVAADPAEQPAVRDPAERSAVLASHD